ncbi:hypothetical protein Aca07nite_88260 [Actinoplanes capillaceus]|uniref:Helix-turn-helix domain-containing protein n=1 Tax=Actinoplanes campanulatus TaxID=113559 RepID=A0ABQ3WZD5_9ACTN|nr:helix-turn-helix transcriptional regulator [Actinoplanes capillaceus]GID51551.1 hypothetical protein Aca07nite_88260 [Actinoplanes capillaceus]
MFWTIYAEGDAVMTGDRWTTPPAVPDEFWTHPPLVQALAARHMGRVLRAYRHHPWHGHRPLSQAVVAGWLGTEQSRLSKIETGLPSRKLDWLRFVARLLCIPGELLWFAVDDDLAVSGDTRRPVRQQRGDGGEPPPRNEQLKAARLRLPSPADPGLRMSRADVAAAVNTYLADHNLPPLYLDATYIGKLERGMARWPRVNLRRALRAVLGAATDADLGFAPQRHTEAERLTGLAAATGPTLVADAAEQPTVVAEPAGIPAIGAVVAGPAQVTVSVDTASSTGPVVVTVSVLPASEPTAQEAGDPVAGVHSLERARAARAARQGRSA